MIVFKTTASAQNFKVIPRTYVSQFTLSIRDDSTNVTTVYEINNASTSGNYTIFSQAFSPVLVEGHFVDIYKDKIFCTDQEIDQMDNLYYNINQGQFITDNSYNNDYIVI